MNIVITSEGIRVDDRQLGARATHSELTEFLGVPIKSRNIPMHPKGTRVASVGSGGLVWYVDLPEDEVSHLYIPICASETPEKPSTDFQGTVLLEGNELSKEISEAAFARLIPNAIRDYGHWWKYQTKTHSLVLTFARTKSETGKRTSTHYLALISIGFLRP